MNISFIHGKSESGDDYYFTNMSKQPLADHEAQAILDDPDRVGDDAGYVYLQHVERW